MADAPINLNKARKVRARTDARDRANVNAAKHGRTKAERQAEAAREALAKRRLDGHGPEDE